MLALPLPVLGAAGGYSEQDCWVSRLFGDGVLTPSISVLSAVEGLKVATRHSSPIAPLTLVLLIALFIVQRHGAGHVAGISARLLSCGLARSVCSGYRGHPISRHRPSLDPRHGIELMLADPQQGFVLLGSVVLAVTGAEALYADMGHFGPAPIRRAWLRFVFPALLLNYFGQGALLLGNPAAIENPFFRLAPDWQSIRSSAWLRRLP